MYSLNEKFAQWTCAPSICTPTLTCPVVEGDDALIDATSNSSRTGGVWPKTATDARTVGITQRMTFIRYIYDPMGERFAQRLHFQDHRHDQRAAGGFLHDVPLQVRADLLLHDAPIRLFLAIRAFERLDHNLARGLGEVGAAFRYRKAAADDLGRVFDAARMAVDGDNRQHDAVFGKVAPVANYHLLHDFVHRAGIDADPAHGDFAGFARALLVDFQNVSGLDDEAVLESREAQVLGQAGVLGKLAELAMDGYEKPRPHQVEDQLHLLGAGVPGDVQRRAHRPVEHVGSAAGHMVDHAENGLLVARNDARAEHHRVAPVHRDVLVVVHGHARQRRHRLALRAGDQHGHLVRRKSHGVLRAQQNVVGNLEQAQRVRDFRDRHHAPAHHGHAPPELPREIQNELDAVNRRTEAGHHHALVRAMEDLFHARANGALRLGEAGPVGIGGIREQQQHAALAVLGQRVQIEHLVVGRRGVHLEIAGVDDHAERRGDGQRHRAHDGMRHVNEFDLEGTDLHDLLRLDSDEARFPLEFVLLQPAFHQRQRERRSVNRDVDLGEKIGHRPDVVFVAMRQHDGADELLVLLEERQVWHHQIDAQQLGSGKHHPAVDHDDVVPEPDSGHVHSELAQSAEGDYLQLLISHRFLF